MYILSNLDGSEKVEWLEDEERYIFLDVPKRISTHRIISGKSVHQDFGISDQDRVLFISGGTNYPIDYDLLLKLNDKYNEKKVYLFKDFIGNEFEVIFADLKSSRISGSAYFRYEIELRVVKVIKWATVPNPPSINIEISDSLKVWWDRVEGAQSYNIYISTSPNVSKDNYEKVVSTTNTEIILTDNILREFTRYYIGVTSVGEFVGEGSISNIVSEINIRLPKSPAELWYDRGDESAVIRWSRGIKGSYDIAGYNIYRKIWDIWTFQGFTSDLYFDTGVLEYGVYEYAIRTVDTAGYNSKMSRILQVEIKDTMKPTRITNLEVIDVDEVSVKLRWTAPFDKSGVKKYYIKYATFEITEESWEFAEEFENTIIPKPSGYIEEITISGLVGNTLYYFGIKSEDMVGNVSDLSNIVSRKTLKDCNLLAICKRETNKLIFYDWIGREVLQEYAFGVTFTNIIYNPITKRFIVSLADNRILEYSDTTLEYIRTLPVSGVCCDVNKYNGNIVILNKQDSTLTYYRTDGSYWIVGLPVPFDYAVINSPDGYIYLYGNDTYPNVVLCLREYDGSYAGHIFQDEIIKRIRVDQYTSRNYILTETKFRWMNEIFNYTFGDPYFSGTTKNFDIDEFGYTDRWGYYQPYFYMVGKDDNYIYLLKWDDDQYRFELVTGMMTEYNGVYEIAIDNKKSLIYTTERRGSGYPHTLSQRWKMLEDDYTWSVGEPTYLATNRTGIIR